MRPTFTTLLALAALTACGGSPKAPASKAVTKAPAAKAPAARKAPAKRAPTSAKARTTKRKPARPDTTPAAPNPLSHGSP